MTHSQSNPDANEIFRWHFRHYAPRAGREALFAESEAENDPEELTRFARYRFSDLLIRFTASFFDSGYAIPGFLPAARRAKPAVGQRP
jgi:hypothetical protein